jgi:type I restriction enzyme, S subunit
MREGWKELALGDVAAIGAGNSAPQKKECFIDGKAPFIRTSDVGQIRIGSISDSRDKLNEKCTEKMRLVKKGSILVPKSGASTFLNHRVMLSTDAYVSSHLATVKASPDHALDAFVHYFLMTIRAQDLIQDHKYPSLKLSDISAIHVSLPPLAEQKRIVAILDEAFAGIATAVANTEKNLANARELYDSYLSAVFSQRGAGWADYRLGDIVTRLTNGYVGPTRGIYQTTGVPYLLARHVKNNRLNFDGKTFITREFNAKNKKSILKYEDVLLVQSGHIGHSAVVTQEHEGHNCHAMIVLTPVNDIVTGPYLSLFFNSPLMQEEFQRIRSGSTVPHLTCREVKELVVTAPKVAEQRSIVERSQEIESRVLELVSIGQQKLNALTELKQCLLQKAFSGELTATPQDEIETALA